MTLIMIGQYRQGSVVMRSHQTNIRDRQVKALERIALALERLAPPVRIPNYQFPLEAFPTFDWESIGASVEQADRSGPSVISWQGLLFMRREPANPFRETIWFARCTGKDERGDPIYQRLITFRLLAEVGPVPERVKRLVTNGAITKI